jgi:hypothetical protein
MKRLPSSYTILTPQSLAITDVWSLGSSALSPPYSNNQKSRTLGKLSSLASKHHLRPERVHIGKLFIDYVDLHNPGLSQVGGSNR